MARYFAWILAAAVACTPTVARAEHTCDQPPAAGQATPQKGAPATDAGRQRPRFVKWWEEAGHRAELGITDQQSVRIEQIFQATLPAQRERYRELEKLEPAVDQLIKDGTADPAYVEKQVERFEYLTAEVRKTRTITLYRMHRELTAEQRTKLKAMFERRDAEHRKSGEPKSNDPRRR
jgi:Spy/CpxP family protein refolding chaperone